MVEKIVWLLLATWSPVSELRGGIPLGLSLGLEPWLTFLIAVLANSVLFFPVFIVMELLYSRLFCRWRICNVYLERVRQKGKPLVDKYGFWGLALFVAVPLPATGAYTGTILSWLLGMDWKRASLSIGLGVFVAGVIVLLIALGIITVLEGLI